MAGSISYRCPNCGDELVYASEKGGFHCPYCSSDFTEEKIKALYEQRGKTEIAKGQATEKRAAVRGELVQYNHPNCDAVIVTEGGTAAVLCYYYRNPVVLIGRLSDAEQPQYALPFAINRKKALNIFSAWIKEKKFVPRAFYDKKQIGKFAGVYFPYLLYSYEACSSLEGVGTRMEHRRRGDVKEIMISKYQINRHDDLPVKVIVRNALKKAGRMPTENVRPFATEDLKPFAPSYLSGFVVEWRNMESDAIQTGTREEMSRYALANLRNSVPMYQGLPVDIENVSLDHEKLEYVLMPIWTMAYREPGSSRLYCLSLNGQSSKVVGELPANNGKLFRYFLTIFIPLFITLLTLMYSISWGGNMREEIIRHISTGVLFAWLFLFFTLPTPARAYATKTRVFDQASLFSAAEEQELEQQITTEWEKMKLDLVVITTDRAGGRNAEAYADDFYGQDGYNYGVERSGVLYLIGMDNHRIHISTAGGSIQLLSDSEIGKLLDLGTSGVKPGSYAESASRVLSGIQDSYRRAQREGWVYDAENGVWAKKKHLSPFAALGSLAAFLIAAFGVMTGVRRSYKMQDGEARRASTVAGIIAISGAAFDFGGLSSRLLGRDYVERRIRRSSGGSGGDRSNGPHDSSSAHTNSGGNSRNGGGRDF